MGCYDQAAVRALGPNELRPKRSSGGKDNNRTIVAVLLFAAKHSGKCNDRGPATHLTKKDSFDRLSEAKERQSYQRLNEPGITLLPFAFSILEDNPDV